MNISNSVCEEVLKNLRQSLKEGNPWAIALLEAVALWTLSEEVFKGKRRRYLIGGEAFDWLLLADRLCYAVDDLLPEQARESLLKCGKLPNYVSKEDFHRILGARKYSGYLNYFYGIIVEEALSKVVEQAVYKQNLNKGYRHINKVALDEVFIRIYGTTRRELVNQFRREMRRKVQGNMSSTEAREFTYWLFKYRLNNSDSSKVASDTRRGLEYLSKIGADGYLKPYCGPTDSGFRSSRNGWYVGVEAISAGVFAKPKETIKYIS